MNKTKWTMPEWMEPFRPYLDHFCSGGSVEELMSEEVTSLQTNPTRALMLVGLAAGVSLLEALNEDGRLIP